MAKQKTYIAIDLKSFYASVECKERNRDPLTTNLVVADKSRTEKTICLAVSPSLKSYGIPGRPRLFEVVQKVKEANNTRRWKALNRTFTGSSDDSTELNANPALEIDYIVAPPRMAYYLEYSTKIYSVYLKYIAPEDIFPYSIDEVFIDATNYLNTYQMTAREHGTANLEKKTSSTRLITNAVMDLYDRIVDEHLLVRRMTITANKLVDEKSVKQEDEYQQLDLFTDYEAQRKKQAEEEEKLERERRMQEAMLSIKKKFGKNAVLKGMNLEEGATAKDRNEQIGGHKA